MDAAPVATATPPVPARAPRLESVDLLRGLVMVVMALDHTRIFFHAGVLLEQNPLDPKTTTVFLFFTRWITHYCAPVFVFLAGTSAFLSSTRGKSPRELSWFLVTRGLWLVLLELTWLRWAGWAFAIDLHQYNAGVIWALGWSMVTLAALIHLPPRAILGFGLALTLGHNALDSVQPADWGALGWLWKVLHAKGSTIDFQSGYFLRIGYPLIPWIGVMAVGYSFGQILRLPAEARRRWLWRAGLGLTVAFPVLRFTNLYGDPLPWAVAERPLHTLFSFLDCQKYPPSLCYLLMTLGPALIVLAMVDGGVPHRLRPLLVFGRVPMFYYLLHLPLIHGLAVAIESLRFGAAPWLLQPTLGVKEFKPPPDAGFGLPVVYLAWIFVVALLYPVCRWFAGLKGRRRDAWLSYL